MDADVLVSIVCNAYNHEKYIRSALDGFVMQKTNFGFEVLIHDDASTDATPQIIQEYADRYPHLIKPILQKENQYSQGVSISKTYQFPRARGQYIAFCEGDDYWTDPYKLQKQVDAMDQHPEVSICAHRAETRCDGRKTGEVPSLAENAIFSVEEVIAGGGGFVNTATLFFRKDMLDNSYRFSKKMSLDYVWQILGSLRGGMLYLGDCMAVYRQMTEGSWTVRAYKDREKQSMQLRRIEAMLRCLDEDTGYRYTQVINRKINADKVAFLEDHNEYKALLSAQYRDVWSGLSRKEKIKIRICAWFPWLVDLRRKLKH